MTGANTKRILFTDKKDLFHQCAVDQADQHSCEGNGERAGYQLEATA